MDTRSYQVIDDAGIRRFILPPRQRTLKNILTGIGCFLLVALEGSILFVLWRFGHMQLQNIHGLLWLIAVAAGFIVKGWHQLFPGHAEVHVAQESLRVVHRLGSGHRAAWRTIDFDQIARLELAASRGFSAFLEGRGTVLSAESPTGTRIRIAGGYPRETLEALAADLQPLIFSAAGSAPPPDFVVDVSNIPETARDVLAQPPLSKIIAINSGDTHTFLVGRWGFLGTPTRYVFFNFLALAFAAIPIAFIYMTYQTPRPNRPPGWNLGCYLAAAVLVIILAGMIVGFHLFLRKSVFLATPGPDGEWTLTQAVKGPLRSSERSWRKSQILHISTFKGGSAGSFGITGTTTPARLRLFVTDTRRKRRALMEGPELEMRWLATELRRILGVPNVTKK